MKYSAAKIAECVAWVEKHGLQPQRFGATLRDFCCAMGINHDTYYQWLKKSAFSESLNRAREVFNRNTKMEVENAILKAARGYDYTMEVSEARAEKVVEYDPKTGKKVREYMGEPKVVKATRRTMHQAPDPKLAVFVATNMMPDEWKQKQETAITTPEGLKVFVGDTAEAEKIKSIKDLG